MGKPNSELHQANSQGNHMYNLPPASLTPCFGDWPVKWDQVYIHDLRY